MDKCIANKKYSHQNASLHDPISKGIAPNAKTEILGFKFGHEKKLEDIDVFSVIRLEVEVNFFIGMFLKVLIFLVPVIGNDNPVSLQISYRKWDLVEELYRNL